MSMTIQFNVGCSKNENTQFSKKAARQQFFDTISTTEINEQLDLSMLDLNDGDCEPQKVERHLEERRVVAVLIWKDTCELSDQDKFCHRVWTANALVALCQKKDRPQPEQGHHCHV